MDRSRVCFAGTAMSFSTMLVHEAVADETSANSVTVQAEEALLGVAAIATVAQAEHRRAPNTIRLIFEDIFTHAIQIDLPFHSLTRRFTTFKENCLCITKAFNIDRAEARNHDLFLNEAYSRLSQSSHCFTKISQTPVLWSHNTFLHQLERRGARLTQSWMSTCRHW